MYNQAIEFLLLLHWLRVKLMDNLWRAIAKFFPRLCKKNGYRVAALTPKGTSIKSEGALLAPRLLQNSLLRKRGKGKGGRLY